MEGCDLLEHARTGSWNVAATSDGRPEWPVRTASYCCLRDHSLVPNCRQRQLSKMFACMYEMHGSSAAEATEVLQMSGIRSIRF